MAGPDGADGLPLPKNDSIVGVFTGAAFKREPAVVNRMHDESMRPTAAGALRPLIDDSVPLEQAPQAMQRLLEAQVNGCIVLRVRDGERNADVAIIGAGIAGVIDLDYVGDRHALTGRVAVVGHGVWGSAGRIFEDPRIASIRVP